MAPGSCEKLSAFLESASQGVLAADSVGTILLVNARLVELFGYTRNELLGRTIEVLLPDRFRGAHARYRQRYFLHPREGPMASSMELAGRRKDGSEFPLEISLSYAREAGETVALAFISDITSRKRDEERLREAAKLESLGVLAGGVAHDFNNLLVGIMGNASLALEELEPGDPARAFIVDALKASERAADLVRQLLAYSGKGKFTLGELDLSRLIAASADKIRASVPKTIGIRLELADDLPLVEADPSQMQQLVTNLVMNSVEAIGDRSGKVIVRTAAEVTSSAAQVRLEVEDDGCGMDAATREKIFDPFFSTKFAGRGLGLAAVQGMVRAHAGTIEVETAPGCGSTFTVRLPGFTRAAQNSAWAANREGARPGLP